MTDLAELLSQLSGSEFEHFIGDLWASRGWNVDVTAHSGDDGVDVVVQDTYYQVKFGGQFDGGMIGYVIQLLTRRSPLPQAATERERVGRGGADTTEYKYC